MTNFPKAAANLSDRRRVDGLTRRFLRGVTALGSGTAAAQIVSIIAAPFLSRLYQPEEFGIYSLFFAIVAPIAVVATARYEVAVQLPAKDRDALRLIHLSLALATMTAVLCLLAGVAIAKFGMFAEVRRDLGPLFFALALGVFLTTALQITGSWTNRIGAFQWRGASSAITAITTVLGQLGAGFLRAGQAGLILLALAGQMVGLFFLMRKGIGGKLAAVRIRSAHTGRVAKEYSDMPRFSAPAALLATLSSSLPIYALNGLFGASAAGLFALAYRVTFLPVSILGTAINQVFFREFTRLRHGGDTSGRGLMLRVWAATAAIALLPTAILLFAGEPLFAFVFGDQWATAGQFAGVLSVGLFFNFVFGATNSSAVVLRLQHWSLGFSIASLVTKLILIAASTMFDWTMLNLVTWFVIYDCSEIVLMNLLILSRLSTPTS